MLAKFQIEMNIEYALFWPLIQNKIFPMLFRCLQGLILINHTLAGETLLHGHL